MRRLFPHLQWFWGAVVFTIIVGAVTNRLFGSIPEEEWAFLRAHGASISLALLGIGALTVGSWLDKRRRERQEATQNQWQAKAREQQERTQRAQQLEQYFALFKPAPDLRPEDLGFQQLKP